MARTVGFKGIGQEIVTYLSALTRGTDEEKVVKVSANKTVALCSDGDDFHGQVITIDAKDADAGVQIVGFITVAYTGTNPTAGLGRKFVANGAGGVRLDDIGRGYDVVDVDTTKKLVTFWLTGAGVKAQVTEGGRWVVVDLAADATPTGGDMISVANPEGEDLLVDMVIIDVTTEVTGAATADVGVAANGTTSSDNLLDALNIGAAAGTFNNSDDQGTNGKVVQKWGASQYITGSASADSTGLVGKAYIRYWKLTPERGNWAIANLAAEAAPANGGMLSIENPEGVDLLIEQVIIDITTEVTGAATADIGVAANGTTSSDTLLDEVDIGSAVGTFNNTDDQGTNGKVVQKWGATQFVTGTASADSTGLVGKAYIRYRKA
jgi:hypothetical protein